MTAIKASDVDRFIARPDPAQPIVLVFGPDAGLVRERVDALVRVSVDDPNDPFALARIEGDELAGNPARLVEEAHTVPLFGGRRAVLVKAGTRNIASAVETVIASPSSECRVIIEAGNLSKSAPLRSLCEKAKVAAALPCYADSERALSQLIDEEMREADLVIASDARVALLALLGSDRLASRNEIRKLALYSRGKKSIEVTDGMAVVADASQMALDGVVDAVSPGEPERLTPAGKAAPSRRRRPLSQRHPPGGQSAQNETGSARGDSIESVMKRAGPPVHYSRERAVGEALRAWPPARLLRAMEQLAEATLEMRRNAPLAEAIAQRTLLSIAVNARKKA
jgi:DNA polymerase-3 subunit delta